MGLAHPQVGMTDRPGVVPRVERCLLTQMHFLRQALVRACREFWVAGPWVATVSSWARVHTPCSLDPVFHEQSVSKDPRLTRDGA